MIVPAEIKRKHEMIRPYVERVATHVRDVVRNYAASEGFAFIDRLKDTESIAEKIETGRYKAWADLDDCYGCALIVPTLQHEKAVLAFLQTQFNAVSVRGRGSAQKDPQVFRFDATRFIGSLRPSPTLQAESQLVRIMFEVQIRTAFEHAWSVTTHSWAYKAAHVDWRRMRLVAQLKAAVEQLDALVAGFEFVEGTLSEQHWPQVAAQKTLEMYFRELFVTHRIPNEAAPHSWTRFCQNLLGFLTSSRREYVRDPVAIVEAALQEITAAMAEWTEKDFPRSVSLLQVCVGLLAERGYVKEAPRGYTLLLTDELRALFPATRKLGNGFLLELDGSTERT
jgi:ppGpp synthetase/RelA/SpoT-type nucleotidyltranferase